MPDYQAVLSSHEISKNIADLLEDIDPIQYNGSNRARTECKRLYPGPERYAAGTPAGLGGKSG